MIDPPSMESRWCFTPGLLAQFSSRLLEEVRGDRSSEESLFSLCVFSSASVYKALPGWSRSPQPHLNGVTWFCRFHASFPTRQECQGHSPPLSSSSLTLFPNALSLTLITLRFLLHISFTLPLLLLLSPFPLPSSLPSPF